MKIADKDGKEFDLPDSVWHHIRQNHPEIKLNQLKQTLRDPDVIIRSNWDETSQLYYKRSDNITKWWSLKAKKNGLKPL